MYSSKDHTEQLVDFAYNLHIDDLPREVIERTKIFILDYYASSMAGYRVNQDFNKAILRLTKGNGGTEQSTVLFETYKCPATDAAFVNAAFAHGADIDDGNRVSAGHIGTSVISAVFALSETLDVTWGDVFVAINIGYEFFNRIAGAAQPDLYNKGFHSTGVAGGIACASACAKLLGLDKEGIYNSVSLAAIQSSGLILIDESGQECKPLNPANAARIGIYSAKLANEGIRGSRNPLDSKKGWFHAFSDQIDEEILTDGLGEKYTICDSYIKLYPTCRHSHCCIDAALDLREQISKEDENWYNKIEKIKITIYPSAIKSAGSISIPQNEGEAKFSLKYAFAVAFYEGKFGINELTPIKGAPVLYIIDRIELVADPIMEDRANGKRGTKVEILLKDGTLLNSTIIIPKGEGNNFLNWNDITNKFIDCSAGFMGEKAAYEFVDRCQNICTNNQFEMMNILFE